MRILIAQMTRMGDMLQNSPMIRALKKNHPDSHITVMVRRMGQTIAERNPDIDDLILLEEDQMFLDLKSGDSDRLLRAYETAEKYISRIREGKFDILYNCTQSFPSTILFTAAGMKEVIGAHLSDDWRYVIRGRGPNYFFTSVLNRDFNDLNLCDLFRYFVSNPAPSEGLTLQITDADRARANSILREHNIGEDDFLVCFQLGASDTHKRWQTSQFAALARMLRDKHNAKIAMLGVEGEAYLGEEFAQHAPGLAIPFFGKTSIPQLAAVLERAKVLVTNDTGTMHVAAAVRCPIALVSVGYVHFRETGPYGVGHIAIERHRTELGRTDYKTADEHAQVTANHVMHAIEARFLTGRPATMPTVPRDASLDSVDLHWSDFAPDGCLQWYPLIRRPLLDSDILRIAYRAMWIDFLATAKPDKAIHEKSEQESMRRYLACYDIPPAEELYKRTQVWQDAIDKLLAIANLGQDLSNRLLHAIGKGKNIARAKELVARLMALDEDIRLQGEIHRVVRPLVAIARFERDNLEGADPALLTRTTAQIYGDMQTRSTLLENKIQQIMQIVEAAKNSKILAANTV